MQDLFVMVGLIVVVGVYLAVNNYTQKPKRPKKSLPRYDHPGRK